MRKSILFAALLLSCVRASFVAADDVSRVPPKAYVEHLAPLLTPADEALKHRADKVAGDDSNISLVTETLRYVDDSGRCWTAIHQIDLARDDQGVGQITKSVSAYRRSDQKAYVALARSLQPDGTVNPVAGNAILVQTPQGEADASVYSDQAELVILFPNVKAKTACESIVVLEDAAAEVPNEFTGKLRFSSNWYHWRRRQLVELPKAMAARLAVTPVGAVPAEPQRSTLANGDVLLAWEQQHAAPLPFEADRAPEEQAGPIVWLSTIKDWNALGAWYRTLLNGRDAAGKELAKRVAERTRGLRDREAIVAALLADAAKDVRYTGLEFGAAGLRPYDPNDVWANRYGDCKDKANLLRVMLRASGVPADLVLVNTEHAGRIEKRSPDIRQFDHMIVAVEQAGGGYEFCDPTIEFARPGMLRPDDADRDVLVLKEGGGVEFVHTPAQDSGESQYAFDLKLAADRSLAGWFDATTHGYAAASMAEFLASDDRATTRRRAQEMVREFYPKAELVDVDLTPSDKFAGSYHLRAYFTVPPDGNSGGADANKPGRATVDFPSADALLPDLTEQKSRQTDFWMQRRNKAVRCRVELPAGWSADALPHAFEVATDAVSASARWTVEGGTVVAHLAYHVLASDVPPGQYALLYNAVSSLRSWMDKPLTVMAAPPGTQPNLAATGPASQPALADFPLMPTGEGQLDLLDKKFPLDGDTAPRREALQRILQWFPDDRLTQFVAQVRLLEMDERDRPKDDATIDRMRKLVASAAKDNLDADYQSWAQYLLARWLAAADHEADAAAIFTRLTGDSNMLESRRAWASYRGAQLSEKADPQKAIALIEGTIEIQSDALPYQFSELAKLLLAKGQAADLKSRLDALAHRSPDDLDKVAASLADDLKQYAAEAPPPDFTPALLDVLDKLIAANSGLAHLRDRVDAARRRVEGAAAYAASVAALRQYLASYHPAWWDDTAIDPALKGRGPFKAAVIHAHDAGTPESFTKYTLEYLTRFPPDPDDFGERVWRLATTLQYRGREPKLADQLLALLDKLPESDRWRWEGALTRAENVADAGDPAAALTLLGPIGDNPKVDTAIRWATYRMGGEYLEQLKRYDDALAMYKRIEGDLSANSRNCEGLLRAIFLNLERGNRPEALRVCGVLAREADSDLEASGNRGQMRDLLALAQDPAAADRFWRRQAAWWPVWLTIAHNAAAPADDEPLVPLIPDPAALERRITAAAEAGDPTKFFASYRVLIHAARWQPRMLTEWAGTIGQAVQAVPQQQVQLRDLVIRALGGLEVADAEAMARAKVQLAANLIDNNRTADALQVVRDALASATRNDWHRQAMHRLWSYAATDPAELERAIAAMRADLDAPEGVADRPRTITRLADVYRQLNRRDLEEALLRRELDNPVIKADADNSRLFATRLNGLSNVATPATSVPAAVAPSAEDPAAFSAAFTGWLTNHRPPWYDFAKPRALADLGNQDLDALLKNPPDRIPKAEVAKIGLLMAADAMRPLRDRAFAFDVAVWQMAQFATRHEEFIQLCAPIFNDARFTEHSRQYWLYAAMRDGAEVPGTRMLRLHPLFAALSAEQRQDLNAMQLDGVDQDSPLSLIRYLTGALAAGPLDAVGQARFERAFKRLVQLSPADARRVYADTHKLSLATGASETAAAVRLRLLRGIESAEAFDAANSAAAGLALERFRPLNLELPADWTDYRDAADLNLLEPNAALALQLHKVRTRRFAPDAFTFWADLFDLAPRDAIDLRFRTGMFEAFVKNLSDDKDRSDVIYLAMSFFDIDVSEQRRRLLDTIAPYRDAKQYPYSSGVIRDLDASLALRDGAPVDIDELMRDQKNSMVQDAETGRRLTLLLEQRDPAAIKRFFADMSAQTLVAADEIPRKLRALRLASMNDEAQLVAEAARDQVYRDVLDAWSRPKWDDMEEALDLAILLDDPRLIPAAWFEDCTAQIHNPLVLAGFRMRAAELRHDWAKVATAADEILAAYSTNYALFWHKGNALFQLGRTRDAADALGTFVRYCKDDPAYADAVAILEKIKGK